MQADAVAAALTKAHRSGCISMLSATVHAAGNLEIAGECAQKKISEAPTSSIRSRFFWRGFRGSCRIQACLFAVGMKRFP